MRSEYFVDPSEVEAHTRSVTVGTLEFPVLDRGEGPAVVLLHGFPDSRHLWRHQVPPLVDAGLRVVAPDLRGFGGAPNPAEVEAYAMPLLVEDVIGIVDALGIDGFALVGHDWGAVVAWMLTAYHPLRVERLVALSAGCPGTSGMRAFEQLERAWYAMIFRYGVGVEDLVRADDWAFLRYLSGGDGDAERNLADLSRPGALTAALNHYRANFHLSFRPEDAPRMPRIGCPVLGVWSDGDRYLVESGMRQSVENVDGPWRYERVEGASHWMMLDRPEETARLLVEFLARS